MTTRIPIHTLRLIFMSSSMDAEHVLQRVTDVLVLLLWPIVRRFGRGAEQAFERRLSRREIAEHPAYQPPEIRRVMNMCPRSLDVERQTEFRDRGRDAE